MLCPARKVRGAPKEPGPPDEEDMPQGFRDRNPAGEVLGYFLRTIAKAP